MRRLGAVDLREPKEATGFIDPCLRCYIGTRTLRDSKKFGVFVNDLAEVFGEQTNRPMRDRTPGGVGGASE